MAKDLHKSAGAFEESESGKNEIVPFHCRSWSLVSRISFFGQMDSCWDRSTVHRCGERCCGGAESVDRWTGNEETHCTQILSYFVAACDSRANKSRDICCQLPIRSNSNSGSTVQQLSSIDHHQQQVVNE